MDTKLVKELREKTGLGIMECKESLKESNGDVDKAIEILRKKGILKAQAKELRVTNQGVVESYIHSSKKLGVLIELFCETDFVAKNEEFKFLAHELALQIAAANPKYVQKSDVPADLIEKEKEIFMEQMKDEKKPDNVKQNIIQNKIDKYIKDICLMDQMYIRDNSKIIDVLIKEYIHKFGENIKVGRFVRMELGAK